MPPPLDLLLAVPLPLNKELLIVDVACDSSSPTSLLFANQVFVIVA